MASDVHADIRLPEVNVTFSEQWWYERSGIDFSERNWTDPILRTERDMAMRRWLHERLGDVGMGEADPKPLPTIEAYGHRFVPALFGCQIRYEKNQAPCEVPLYLNIDQMAELQTPDIDTAPVTCKARSDAEILTKKYGWCNGAINWGGPLNASMSIVGQELLTAFAVAPEAADHVLGTVAKTLIRLHDEICAPISPQLYNPKKRGIFIGDCQVIMVSPKTYREQILPHDKWLRAQASEYHLHHCGKITNYLDAYSELSPLAWIQPGWGSDISATRRTFPESTISMLMECSVLQKVPMSEMDEIVFNMIAAARPLSKVQDIWIADVSSDISDDYIRHLRTCHLRLKNRLLALD
jgi:hypothetical protein